MHQKGLANAYIESRHLITKLDKVILSGRRTTSSYNEILRMLSNIEVWVDRSFGKSPKEVALRKMSKLLRELNSMEADERNQNNKRD